MGGARLTERPVPERASARLRRTAEAAEPQYPPAHRVRAKGQGKVAVPAAIMATGTTGAPPVLHLGRMCAPEGRSSQIVDDGRAMRRDVGLDARDKGCRVVWPAAPTRRASPQRFLALWRQSRSGCVGE